MLHESLNGQLHDTRNRNADMTLSLLALCGAGYNVTPPEISTRLLARRYYIAIRARD